MFEGLDAEAYDRSYSDVALARRIFRYLATQRRYVMMVVGTVLLISVADLVQPIVIAQGVGTLVASPSLALLIALVVVVSLAARFATRGGNAAVR